MATQSNLQRIERHPDYDYLIDNGLLTAEQMVEMSDEEISRFAATEQYEDSLDDEGR